MTTLSTVKGFADLYPDESRIYTFMENTARRVFGAYGYGELRTPIMEHTELFQRSIGTETDVVQKEMYTFPDRKGRSLTLRPEATAGVMRSYIENSCHARESVSKFFTCGPMFRYERPQKGRMRQFHQLNCECLGVHEPQLDAEVILMLMFFLNEIGLSELRPEINSLGCRQCRPGYKKLLTAFLRRIDPESLCEDCRRRMETSPMRVLDCKVPSCREQTRDAPAIREHLCSGCDEHFNTVLGLLDKEGVDYTLNPRLVRGLDYYTRTTFEVVSTSIGAQGSVAGGGRYDGLVQDLGGPDVPGIGFACGMERLAMMLREQMRLDPAAQAAPDRPDFYLAVLDKSAADRAVLAAQTLRRAGLSGEMSFEGRSLKSQLRQASRLQAEYCLMLGEAEIAAQSMVVKHMDSGEQVNIPLASLADWAEIRYEQKQQRHRKGGAQV
ncbi:histidine--tRNA ligase [Desulfovibrio sp. OttesenSCG-928-A18]|nr:histidine--tRNA ligase [Desulfovibrio sp. OttesenSCG-928-A18]